MKKQFLTALAAAILGVGAVFATMWYVNRPPVLGAPFTLNHQGQPWDFSQHAKKLNILYIGYAKCPDVCPMALSFTAEALQKLSDKERQKTQMVFISVDAANDTAESVAVYAQQFDPQFVGLTGTQEQIDQAIKAFGASYIVEKNEKSYLGYSIAHTDRLYLLNKKGHVIETIASPRSADEILQQIKEIL